MATYLELVQDLARESGSMDWNAITTVTGLTGRSAKMAKWVQQGYINIQNHRYDWGWLVEEFSWPLIPGTAVYTANSFNLTRFGAWHVDRHWYEPLSIRDDSMGLSNEQPLPQVCYEEWRSLYGRGDTSNWGRPTLWAISPKNEIAFGAIPDLPYVVRGQYTKGPQVLLANGDIPEMPERFHQLIMWEALRLLMLHDGAYDEASFPTQEMAVLRHELELDQLPEVTVP